MGVNFLDEWLGVLFGKWYVSMVLIEVRKEIMEIRGVID